MLRVPGLATNGQVPANGPPRIVSIEGVVKHYEGRPRPVLCDVSLEIGTHDLVSIVGTSGAGKTTLLNILGCIDKCSSGRYLLGGIDVARLPEKPLASLRADSIGYIFQQYHLVDHLDVVGNLEVRFLYGSKPAPAHFREQISRTLDHLGIRDLADKFPRNLSGGEMQRVAIARAVVKRPRLLLADEPTGNLDQDNTTVVFELLRRIASEGTGVVIATHDSSLARECLRRFVLVDGRLLDAS